MSVLTTVGNGLKSVKYMTWIILAITIAVLVLTVYYTEYYNTSFKEQIEEQMNVHLFYTLLFVVVFAVMTHMLVKIETGAIYSMKCQHGESYRTQLSKTQHMLWRLLHFFPFVGDLVNVYYFHTCSRQ
tara:strand:+ start:4860 stop:5243 length:384 start_codon:yes stop_codon:yes gene_type:complete